MLSEHDLPVTALDWAGQSNRIVSCSQDKNAFVWTPVDGGKAWKPELVLVRINRAATSVKWSPAENKFAVGSSARLVSVCYYERENDWWVAKLLKKPINSTVTSIDWHPINVLLAVGCCDFKARVMSAYVKEVDEKPSPNPWGSKMPWGQLMSEYSSGGGGWVHSIRFSPSGCRLAWVGHDSSLSVVDANDSDRDSITTVKDWWLPFAAVEWVTENSLVTAGHDNCPMLFAYEGPNRLKFVSKLDVPSEQKAGSGSGSALNMFRSIDRRGQDRAEILTLKTLHLNAITQICPHSGGKQSVTKFSTVAVDGQLILWGLKALESQVASITVS